MFRYVISGLAVLGILGLAAVNAASVYPSTPDYFASLVRVDITLDGAEQGHGSGFILSPTKIVTAKHVAEGVKEGQSLHVTGAAGMTRKVVKVQLWPDYDFAILTLATPMSEPTVRLNCGSVEPLDTLSIVGYPLHFTASVYQNTVVSYFYEQSEEVILLLTTGVALPGNSGGPVFDQEGRVVGILIGEYLQRHEGSLYGTNVNRIVPLREIGKVCG